MTYRSALLGEKMTWIFLLKMEMAVKVKNLKNMTFVQVSSKDTS